MTIPTRPLHEISREGHAALVRVLGVTDAIRFLEQYTTGRGDYTAEREAWLENEPMDTLIQHIRQADRQWTERSGE